MTEAAEGSSLQSKERSDTVVKETPNSKEEPAKSKRKIGNVLEWMAGRPKTIKKKTDEDASDSEEEMSSENELGFHMEEAGLRRLHIGEDPAVHEDYYQGASTVQKRRLVDDGVANTKNKSQENEIKTTEAAERSSSRPRETAESPLTSSTGGTAPEPISLRQRTASEVSIIINEAPYPKEELGKSNNEYGMNDEDYEEWLKIGEYSTN